ncbi:hypothetical protein Ccrd_020588 [Cynara cardunculus var. scolymus]|uniref:Uncharacterized protein n=1 Tax=Cynara cardunculus var. scolymus TaxID=59895 RepID=A0A118K0A7_CYNCS|nr:hypothetical protein Ccrd_020588 [Cynara cardunculus var. scolymus]
MEGKTPGCIDGNRWFCCMLIHWTKLKPGKTELEASFIPNSSSQGIPLLMSSKFKNISKQQNEGSKRRWVSPEIETREKGEGEGEGDDERNSDYNQTYHAL